MRIIEPRKVPVRNRRRWSRLTQALCGILVMTLIGYIGAGLVFFLAFPPLVRPEVRSFKTAQTVPALPWPGYGQAAFGSLDEGLLAKQPASAEQARPIASVTKLITALTILKKHPLAAGQSGPNIPITQQDLDSYHDYYSRGGSVVAVAPGMQLNQYQALQGLLLPSGNNMSDTLAVWAYGSMSDYLKAANDNLQSLGMTNSSVADASGFSPKSRSTAADLIKLGQAVLSQPVLAEIVAQKQAIVPVAGEIVNTNIILGAADDDIQINGIKTGNTDEAGGCFLGSATYKYPGGLKTTVIAAVVGAPHLDSALLSARKILHDGKAQFGQRTVLPMGSVVAVYRSAWGSGAEAVTTKDLTIFGWLGHKPSVNVQLNDIPAGYPATKDVGRVKLSGAQQSNKAESSVRLRSAMAKPSLNWRVNRVRERLYM